MGKLTQVSQDGARCIMLCLKRAMGVGTGHSFHFSASMGSVALITGSWQAPVLMRRVLPLSLGPGSPLNRQVPP